MTHTIAVESCDEGEPAPIVFNLEMLPAGRGDCLLLEYGTLNSTRFILIDGGPYDTYLALRERLKSLPFGLELIIVSHIDADHIEGIIKLLRDSALVLPIREVWFNGWPQIERLSETLSPVAGEYLSAAIQQRCIPWNKAFHGLAAISGAPESRTVNLADGLRLTLLSPTTENLLALRAVWKKTLVAAGMHPGSAKDAIEVLLKDRRFRDPRLLHAVNLKALARETSTPDSGISNGSSIAVLAEYRGASILCAADAHPQVLQQAIETLLTERKERRLRLDALKVSHHGSRRNTTADLMRLLDCKNFLISTDGSYFRHPDDEAIARIILASAPGAVFHCNYRPAVARIWDDAEIRKEYSIRVVYPDRADL